MSDQLTEYAELHGCSCKVGQREVEDLLATAGADEPTPELLLGVGEDAAARQLDGETVLVQTLDYFTPVVDDPFEFGRIAACNAASDAFATGATANLSCLVVLGVPQGLTDVSASILSGMTAMLTGMDGVVAGGHTIHNPWPLAGGAVTATVHPDDLLSMSEATPGDNLYLTKPLGTQPATGALRVQESEFAETVGNQTDRPIDHIGADAIEWMTTPNTKAAVVAREHASAATDVTGFGLAGQARTLAERANVGIELTDAPVIEGTPELSALFGYGLEDGESAETSGGLLVSVPTSETTAFEESLRAEGVFHSRVGHVTDGTGVDTTTLSLEPVSD